MFQIWKQDKFWLAKSNSIANQSVIFFQISNNMENNTTNVCKEWLMNRDPSTASGAKFNFFQKKKKNPQILHFSKLKEFADNNFKDDENDRKFFQWVENNVGKEVAY